MSYPQIQAELLTESRELRARLQGALQDIEYQRGTIANLEALLRGRDDALAAAQRRVHELEEAEARRMRLVG